MRTRFSTSIEIACSGPLGPFVARLTLGIDHRYLGLEAAGLKRRGEQR